MVQWGRQSERDRARIIGAGTEEEMRELLKKKQDPHSLPPNPQESSSVLFSPPVSPRSPTPPPKEPARKKQKTQKTAKVRNKFKAMNMCHLLYMYMYIAILIILIILLPINKFNTFVPVT